MCSSSVVLDCVRRCLIACVFVTISAAHLGSATGTLNNRGSILKSRVRRLTCRLPTETVSLEPLLPKSIKAGKSATFLCTLIDGRGAAFSWTKDGLLLRDSDRLEITTSRKTSLIRIDSVEMSDSGLYTCIASGGNSEDRTSARLTVEGEICGLMT